MIESLGQRLVSAASRGLGGRLARPLAADAARSRRDAAAVLGPAGVELERVLRLRGDGRSVFLVRHPVWGRCVLKGSDPIRAAGAGLANLAIARLVEEAGAPFFPQIHEMTAGYTIEEHIEGTEFRRWAERGFDMAILEEYLTGLKRWGATRGPWKGEETLRPHEIRSILRMYVQKCVSQSGYRRPLRGASALHGLFRHRREVLEDLRWLAEEADRIAIPRGLMCGDMSNVNLLVDEARRRIFMIDYEFMSPGNVGFDCAYLLASLRKLPAPPEAARGLDALVHSVEFAGSPERARFFSAYADVLTRISWTVYGRRYGSAPVGPCRRRAPHP